ncbi:MAG TPA: hypothetical protein VK886_03615 [Vicinamibacterales bacterium]|nr:hypothetical protein [Vicinamibacterales bacterium]
MIAYLDASALVQRYIAPVRIQRVENGFVRRERCPVRVGLK